MNVLVIGLGSMGKYLTYLKRLIIWEGKNQH